MKRLDHRSLAEAFIQANALIAEQSANLQIPPPMLEYTAKQARKNAKRITLGHHYYDQRRIEIHLPKNETPQNVIETAYHEFGHYIDTFIFRRALGAQYWLPMINQMQVQPLLLTESIVNDGSEDFADSIMLFLAAPTPEFALTRIGYARMAAISEMILFRCGGKHTISDDDPYGVRNYVPLVHSMTRAVRDRHFSLGLT